jgi:hypothetical protein
VDEKQSFATHLENLVKKIRLRIGFITGIRLSQKELLRCTFLSVLDYRDVIYMQTSSTTMKALDSVVRFITNQKLLTPL